MICYHFHKLSKQSLQHFLHYLKLSISKLPPVTLQAVIEGIEQEMTIPKMKESTPLLASFGREEMISRPNEPWQNFPEIENYCYAISVITCLFNITAFKNEVLSSEVSTSQTVNFPMLSLLRGVFTMMSVANAKQWELRLYFDELIKEFNQRNPQTPNKRQKSPLLFFQTLLNNISPSDVLVEPFFGRLINKGKCKGCKTEFLENSMPPIVEVSPEIYRNSELHQNLLQSRKTNRYCKNCQKTTVHEISINLEEIPEVLLLKVEPLSDNSRKVAHRVASDVTISIPEKTKDKLMKYNFLCGVFGGIFEGSHDSHSFSVIIDDQDELRKHCYIVSDGLVQGGSLEQINGYPILLFYIRDDEIDEYF